MTKNEMVSILSALNNIYTMPEDFENMTKENLKNLLNNSIVQVVDELEMLRIEYQKLVVRTNETTDPESGAPQQMELNYPRGGQLEYLIKTLRIRPQSPIWEAVNINDLGGDHFTIWIDKERYQHGADTYKFLGKLKKITNDRGYEGWFGGDCLHIQL